MLLYTKIFPIFRYNSSATSGGIKCFNIYCLEYFWSPIWSTFKISILLSK